MPQIFLEPLDRPGVAPLPISPRLRSQLVYFGSPDGTADGGYAFDAAEVAKYLEEGVFFLVSPLDTANKTEVELTEEQESFLQWLLDHDVRRARLRS